MAPDKPSLADRAEASERRAAPHARGRTRRPAGRLALWLVLVGFALAVALAVAVALGPLRLT